MKQLITVLKSEMVKLKPASIVWLFFIMPVVIIYFYCFYYYPLVLAKHLSTQPSWEYFISGFFSINVYVSRFLSLKVYGLILPSFIAIAAALMTNPESSNRCWSRCFTLPVPRWKVYFAKLILVHCLTVDNLILSGLLLIVCGIIFNQVYPEQAFIDLIPWLQCLKLLFSFYAASFAVIALQLWIGMKFREGSTGISIGVGLSLLTIIVLYKYTILNYFNPWMIDLSIIHLGLTGSLLTRAALGILLSSVIGFWVNSRYEVASRYQLTNSGKSHYRNIPGQSEL